MPPGITPAAVPKSTELRDGSRAAPGSGGGSAGFDGSDGRRYLAGVRSEPTQPGLDQPAQVAFHLEPAEEPIAGGVLDGVGEELLELIDDEEGFGAQ